MPWKTILVLVAVAVLAVVAYDIATYHLTSSICGDIAGQLSTLVKTNFAHQ